jgi:uncharacterized membrane protein (UPF0127 family)
MQDPDTPKGRRLEPALIHTATGTHRLAIRLADRFLPRFLGLMLRGRLPAGHGLLITRCSSVHSMFMRHPLDLLYLDRDGRVTRCVPGLKPWRASWSRGGGGDASGQRPARASHVLELAEGEIERLGIAPGDRLSCRLWEAQPRGAAPATAPASRAQAGSAVIEFTIIAPVVTMLALSVIQYGMLFSAKNQINHAAFMAARAGAAMHADLGEVGEAYARGLAPIYAKGATADAMAQAVASAKADQAQHVRIELLNPTRESFDDWNEPGLQAYLKTGSRRVIPNSGKRFENQGTGPTSGQTIHDANLIKLRITHGYEPKIPLVNRIYKLYLTWLDPKNDDFYTRQVEDGRIPVVTAVTLQMQSDAIEPDNPVSFPGAGNGGKPADPGPLPATNEPPPFCTTMGCWGGGRKPPETECSPATDPAGCRPPWCREGDKTCDPNCGNLYCCVL